MADSSSFSANVTTSADSTSTGAISVVTTNVTPSSTVTANVINGGVGSPGTPGAAGVGVPTGGTAGQVLSKIDATNYNTQWVAPAAGSGTVTSVSVTTTNGVSGTVASSTTTPAISLSLGAVTPTSVAASGTVTGSNLSGTNTGDETTATIKTKLGVTTLSGSNTGDQTLPTTLPPNGTASGDLSGSYPSPTVAKINGTALSGLSTGILKNTTTTGVPSIAVAADFPTLNQNTTGTASSITGSITESQVTNLTTDLAAKQATLVSGTNLKTVGGITLLGSGDIPLSGSGTVTSASVVTANGFAGTVATATTTPAITLTTSVTGVLKGNGTAISAATAGTDYTTPTGTETLTNKTITSPKVDSIKDSNGNTIIDLLPTASSVNYLQVKNNAATFTPGILAVGTDTNINVDVTPKGTGRLRQSGVIVPTVSSADALTNKDLTSGTNTFPTFNQNTTGTAAGITGKTTPTGALVGDTDTQTLANKTLNNTNTVTIKAANFTIQDGTDTTKQAQFIASGITTGTTASYTLPGASTTLVGTAGASTITGVKTFSTAPVISTITNTGTLTLPTTTGTLALTSSNITGTAAGLSANIAESQVTNLTTDLAAKQAALTLTTTGTSGAATLVGGALNIPNYAGGGTSLKLPTYTVGASNADFTTIQAALDAATSGGTIYLTDASYTITSTLLIKGSNVRLVGNKTTIIQCDGAVATTLIKSNSTSFTRFVLENVTLKQTNATVQGIAIDGSNLALSVYQNLTIDSFGTAISLADTANLTFYNRFSDIFITGCNSGISIAGTNPANDNMFSNIRISLLAGGAGKGLSILKGQSNNFYNLNVEPGTGTGITGVSLAPASNGDVYDTNFYGLYAEANATNVIINSNTQRTTFFGGQIVAALTTNVSDSGQNTQFFGTDVGFAQFNQQSPTAFTDNTSASQTLQTLKNNTSFAHASSNLWKAQLLNGSDTSNVVRIENAGTGHSISGTNGTTENFWVDNTGKVFSKSLQISTASAPTVGYVWTATDTSGNGSWQVAAGAGGGLSRNISTVTTTVTVGATASTDYTVFIGASGVVTLPTAVGNTNQYTLKNIDSSNKTISTTSAQTIDGSSTATLTPNTSLVLQSDGANWRAI